VNDGANRVAIERLCAAEPVLVDVRRAGDVVPGLTRETVLTSGAPLPWPDYVGGQRTAILGAAVFEGMARDLDEAAARFKAGELRVGACHAHGCIGSLAGVYSASMPVVVVENRAHGTRAFCNLFEGTSPARLNYGVWNEAVRDNLAALATSIAPLLGEAVRAAGGIALRPIIRRALHMGDELHSRNTAGSLLFTRELFPHLVEAAVSRPDDMRRTIDFLAVSEYFFLRLSMAAAKATADAAHGIEGSSVLTGMVLSGHDFAIRVGGLGDDWIRGPLPSGDVKLFEGYTEDDIEYMGGESCMTECIGLGGFAQAAAPALQAYQGGSFEKMMANNLALYDITLAEHPDFAIPALGFRGTPAGIDLMEVLRLGRTPMIDGGLAGSSGGQIGAGLLVPDLDCFESALAAYRAQYDTDGVR